MSDADCTPGREPHSVAAIVPSVWDIIHGKFCGYKSVYTPFGYVRYSARILFPPVMLTGGVRQVRWFVDRTASWCGFDRRQRLRTAGAQPAIRPSGLSPTGAQLVTPALLLYGRRRRCLLGTAAIKARRAITITALACRRPTCKWDWSPVVEINSRL